MPLYCHNEHYLKTPYRQLEIFDRNGLDFEKVIIGHCSDSYDLEYLEEIAKAKVYLAFDRIYPSAYERQASVIAKLIERGYEDKILLSHDYFAFIDFGNSDFEKQKLGNRDFTTVHKKLIPTFEKLGVKKENIFFLQNTLLIAKSYFFIKLIHSIILNNLIKKELS